MPKYEDWTETELREKRNALSHSSEHSSSEADTLIEEIEDELRSRRAFRRRA